MKKILLALIITTSTLMAVSTVQANNFYVGASAGYNNYDFDENDTKNFIFGFDVGYRFTKAGIDLGIYLAPPQTIYSKKEIYLNIRDTNKIKSGQYLFKATYAFLGTHNSYIINPYVGVTLGMYSLDYKRNIIRGSTVRRNYEETKIHTGAGVLIGAECKINDKFVTFAEAGYALITRENSNINNFKGLVGLKFLF